MRRIAALWLSLIVILLAPSFNAPQAGALDSPLVTPLRPTPTGWHNGTPPPSPLMYALSSKVRERDSAAVEAQPTPTSAPAAPRVVIRARVTVQVVERRAWEVWKRHNVD
jgi:hypothetical protein